MMTEIRRANWIYQYGIRNLAVTLKQQKHSFSSLSCRSNPKYKIQMKDLLNSFQNHDMNIFGESHSGCQSQKLLRNLCLLSRSRPTSPSSLCQPWHLCTQPFSVNCYFHSSLEPPTDEPPINELDIAPLLGPTGTGDSRYSTSGFMLGNSLHSVKHCALSGGAETNVCQWENWVLLHHFS